MKTGGKRERAKTEKDRQTNKQTAADNDANVETRTEIEPEKGMNRSRDRKKGIERPVSLQKIERNIKNISKLRQGKINKQKQI